MSKKGKRSHRIRRSVTWVLVVLSALLVPISVLTVWAVRTISDTDQFVATMAPLARQQVITDYVAVRATDVLFEKVDVQGHLSTALPPRASFAAAPITNQVHSFVEDQFKTLLRSTWFQQAWDKANRRLHSSLVTFLEGNQLPAGQKAQEIAIQLNPVLEKGIARLHKQGITIFDPLQARLKNATNLSVTVSSKPQVKSIRGVFHLAKTVGWVVPLVALVLIAAAIAVAVDRRKTLLRLAVGVSIATVVVLGLVAYERNFFVTHAAARASPEVTGAVYDTLSHFLRDTLRLTLLVSVVVAVLMWLIGPARWPRSLRRLVGRGFHWLALRFGELAAKTRSPEASARVRRVAGFPLEHASGFRLFGVIVVGCILVFGGNLSGSGILWSAVALAAYLLALEGVLMWARRLTTRSNGDDGSNSPVSDESAQVSAGSADPP
ncbi:MAG TPA: hypothetical protein VGI44_18745 [Acidimicrobiales bacterium]